MSIERTTFPHQGRPEAGLYDASTEHDACGVGFVVDMKGRKSHQTLERALTILDHLEHRGASGAEINTGDGAGILIQIPDRFLRRECGKLGFELPPAGHYAAGMIFLPRAAADAAACENEFAKVIAEEGLTLLGWRELINFHCRPRSHLLGSCGLLVIIRTENTPPCLLLLSLLLLARV